MFIAQLYQDVTNRIIAEMEQGVVPWVRPWKTSISVGSVMPHNASTGRAYHGINIPILWDAGATQGFTHHLWLTYKQATEKNARVRKGEKGTHVVFTKKLRVKDRETEEDKTVSMLKTYVVFNIAQLDGCELPAPPAELPIASRYQRADDFVTVTGADIRYNGDIACFVPSRDFIAMPPRSSFKTEEGFFATILHELGHWAGGEKRLDRKLDNRFGTRAYAAEELIAEMTSAFLCAHLGIEGELRHAGYIAVWLKLLKEDNRAIFTAASKASQGADYLRSCYYPSAGDE